MTTTHPDNLENMEREVLEQVRDTLDQQGAYSIVHELNLLIAAKIAQEVDAGTMKTHGREALDKVFADHVN